MDKATAMSVIKKELRQHYDTIRTGYMLGASPFLYPTMTAMASQIREEKGYSGADAISPDGYYSKLGLPEGFDIWHMDQYDDATLNAFIEQMLGEPDENGMYTPELSVFLEVRYSVVNRNYHYGEQFERYGIMWTYNGGWSA